MMWLYCEGVVKQLIKNTYSKRSVLMFRIWSYYRQTFEYLVNINIFIIMEPVRVLQIFCLIFITAIYSGTSIRIFKSYRIFYFVNNLIWIVFIGWSMCHMINDYYTVIRFFEGEYWYFLTRKLNIDRGEAKVNLWFWVSVNSILTAKIGC